MGPLIVLDKSALQCFSRDEVQVLAKHYLLVVVPILLIEILADLKKEPPEGRMPEDDVVWLSGKLSGSGSKLNVPYQAACIESMLGNDPPPGNVLMGGAKNVQTKDGQKGIFFDEPKEYQALRNWRACRFDEAEKVLAEEWRRATAAIDLESFRRSYAERLKGKTQPRTLDELLPYIDRLLAAQDQGIQKDLIAALLGTIGPPEEFRAKIFDRWLKLRMPRLREFSPYAHYCLRTMLIFQAGLAFGLISTRATNRIDLEYLFYAHFGYVFCSNDKFHRTMSLYVLREFQTFVEADVLKKDLKWLHDEWGGLSESEREQRAYDYGSYPPQNPDSITHQMWVKYMNPWKPGSGNRAVRMTKEEEEKLLAEMRPIMDAIDEESP
jgi:hypothetical protein